MNSKKFNTLIQKYRDGELQGEQKVFMDKWFDALDKGNQTAWTVAELEALGKKIREQIDVEEGKKPAQRLPLRRWLPYAAAILILALASSVYLMVVDDRWSEIGNRWPINNVVQQDVEPGTNRASLTLADGRTVELSSRHAGIIVGNELTYNDGSSILGDGPTMQEKPQGQNPASAQSSLSTMHYLLKTPRGGQYQVTLPDGSKVWLNAASTLKYPAQFIGDSRIVELEGEAYFEVTQVHSVQSALSNPQRRNLAHRGQQKIPFIVKTKNQEVEVLGTQFNITAYGDEPETKTTLVEGAVAVRHILSEETEKIQSAPIILSPGQESILTASGIQTRKANIEAVVAWKLGIFHFDETPFDHLMKQIARWYAIDVKYEGKIPQERFSGKMSRNVNLQVLLTFLKDSDIPLQVKDRALIVGK